MAIIGVWCLVFSVRYEVYGAYPVVITLNTKHKILNTLKKYQFSIFNIFSPRFDYSGLNLLRFLNRFGNRYRFFRLLRVPLIVFNFAFFNGFDLFFLLLENTQCFARVFDDPWSQKDVKIGFYGFVGPFFKQPAEQRYITQGRYFIFTHGGRIVNQSADNDGLLVLDDDGGVYRPFQGNRQCGLSRQGGLLVDGGHLEADLHAHQAVFGDMGGNF